MIVLVAGTVSYLIAGSLTRLNEPHQTKTKEMEEGNADAILNKLVW